MERRTRGQTRLCRIERGRPDCRCGRSEKVHYGRRGREAVGEGWVGNCFFLGWIMLWCLIRRSGEDRLQMLFVVLFILLSEFIYWFVYCVMCYNRQCILLIMKAHRVVRHAAEYLSLPFIKTLLIASIFTAVANSVVGRCPRLHVLSLTSASLSKLFQNRSHPKTGGQGPFKKIYHKRNWYQRRRSSMLHT